MSKSSSDQRLLGTRFGPPPWIDGDVRRVSSLASSARDEDDEDDDDAVACVDRCDGNDDSPYRASRGGSA